MHKFARNRFSIENLPIDSLFTPIVESTYVNINMCKFESSQKDGKEHSRVIPQKHAESLELLTMYISMVC